METERSHFPYRAIDRTKANLSVRHDDYVMFSFAGKHPLGLLPQSTTDGRLIPQYENNIEARTEFFISVFEPETFCSTVKGFDNSQEKKRKIYVSKRVDMANQPEASRKQLGNSPSTKQ